MWGTITKKDFYGITALTGQILSTDIILQWTKYIHVKFKVILSEIKIATL